MTGRLMLNLAMHGRRFLFIFAAAMTAACALAEPARPDIDRFLDIQPTSVTMPVRLRLSLTARVVDRSWRVVLDDVAATFRAEDTTIAQIIDRNVVESRRVGTTNVLATFPLADRTLTTKFTVTVTGTAAAPTR
jgi:hypothetical protein